MTKKQVCAIVVFYKAGEKEFLNVIHTDKQTSQTIVVFNGQTDTEKELTQKHFAKTEIKTIINDQNLGIAAALNQGVKKAIKQNFQWVLTLDQDSTIGEKMVDKMLSVYEEMLKDGINKNQIGILEPVLVDKLTGFEKRKNKSELTYIQIKDCYTSGNLIPTEVFSRAGFYNEGLFLYHVDTDFNLNLINNGLKIYEVSNATLYHQEGSLTEHKLFGKTFSTTNHSKIARYYFARNEILMLRKYWLTNPNWCLESINWYIRMLLKVVIFEKDRLAKFKFTIIGILDGMMNRIGKL
ncbi:MAG: glycosyltransferase [bacterium]